MDCLKIGEDSGEEAFGLPKAQSKEGNMGMIPLLAVDLLATVTFYMYFGTLRFGPHKIAENNGLVWFYLMFLAFICTVFTFVLLTNVCNGKIDCK